MGRGSSEKAMGDHLGEVGVGIDRRNGEGKGLRSEGVDNAVSGAAAVLDLDGDGGNAKFEAPLKNG